MPTEVFKFSVAKRFELDYTTTPFTRTGVAWCVELPPGCSCHEMQITSTPDKSEAIKELDLFIAEAQQARTKLIQEFDIEDWTKDAD